MIEAKETMRILIADDHPLVRDGLRTVLTVAFDQCELFEASSSAEAIRTIDQLGDFDLILLDLNMPGGPGLAGLTVMRNQFPSIPVIVVSATFDKKLIRGAIALGAAGFISKSLNHRAIVEALRMVAAGGSFFSDIGEEEGPVATEPNGVLASLTPQQKIVLDRLAEGQLNKQIAYELNVSINTVKAHVSAIFSKLNVVNRTQAVLLRNRVKTEF